MTRLTRGRGVMRRVGTTAAMAAILGLAPASLASASADGEAYPPAATSPTVVPQARPALPATGADGTEDWLKLGGAAVMLGGLLVVSARRRAMAG